jgi:hypothetical protein
VKNVPQIQNDEQKMFHSAPYRSPTKIEKEEFELKKLQRHFKAPRTVQIKAWFFISLQIYLGLYVFRVIKVKKTSDENLGCFLV